MTKDHQSSEVFTGLTWVMTANAVYLGASASLTLLLPRFINPYEFGLWQLYQLFALYLGYVTLGYTDGLNLRLAGRRLPTLSPTQLSSGLVYLLVIDALLFLSMASMWMAVFPGEASRLFVWAAIGAIIYVPRTVVTIVFQSTLNVKRYAIVLVLERVVLVLLVAAIIALGDVSASGLVAADVTAKLTSLLCSLALGRSVFLARPRITKPLVTLFLRDCGAGFFVLVANVSAMLINGGVRLIIVDGWGVIAFGQVSLAFQFASLFMVAVNSVAISALPNLKRLPEHEYGSTYEYMRQRLVTPLIASLVLCFPLVALIKWWLPAYTAAAYYTALLYPIVVYEAMNRGLTGVFMKALRLERTLMTVNICALVVALTTAVLGTYVWDSLTITVFAILLALGVRAFLGEIVVSRRIGFGTAANWAGETTIIGAYLWTVTIESSMLAVVLIVPMSLAYLTLQHRSAARKSNMERV